MTEAKHSTLIRNTLRPRILLAVLLVFAFAAGVWVSPFIKKIEQMHAASPPTSTDYSVYLPEGQTVITISDPKVVPEQLARLVLEKHGSNISGLPQRVRSYAPRERLSREDVAFFRHQLGGVITGRHSDWELANRIREWLARISDHRGLPGLATRNPREAYEQMRHGLPVLCGNLAQIYVALCEASGLTARTVGLDVMARDGQLGRDAHAGAEIWIPTMGGWIYEDPTFNCYWKVNDKVASALQLHNALLEQREITLDPSTAHLQTATQNYIDPRQYFRQLSYEYRPGGDLLYYADARLEPLSMGDRNWSQTSDAADLTRLDSNGLTIIERRGEVASGVYVQIIGDRLFVRDRREQRGIRVRSSTSAVESCAYEHRRAEDLGLFSNENFVRNASFRFRGVNEFLAQDWSVSGPVEAMTLRGGQGMSTKPGGKLWQRFPVSSGKYFVMYARLTAVRGDVVWSLSSPGKHAESTGIVESWGGVSEIVSDVVVSEDGELDVAFEVPDGGAFRVMDVIVTEAPKFEHAQTHETTRTANAKKPGRTPADQRAETP